MFEKVYLKVMYLAKQPQATWYLALLSFLESFVLPFPPPDVMLAPMSLARPSQAMRFASITLFASVFGGITGYIIGAFLFEQVQPLLIEWGYQSKFDIVMQWFEVWGFWAVLVAGFSPVPYKLFTLSAGVLSLAIMPFILASIIGRGLRFFLVAWCLSRFGPAIEKKLIQYVERIGWAVVAILVIFIGIYYLYPMHLLIKVTVVSLGLQLLVGCINPHAVMQRSGGQGWYQVKPSDTLYSIAWRYGLDYKALARWNQINVNSTIYPGQKLLLIEPASGTQTVIQTTDSISKPPKTAGSSVNQPATLPASSGQVATTSTYNGINPTAWWWPTKGKLVSTYSARALDRRGIDIAGNLGQPIQAVADGRVVYSGNGLAGYGNLIIIKHSEAYLSAYAYNQQRMVKEGMTVKAGDLIAKMGKHKTRTARLHFQIRKNGKPVDPLQFLPKR